jgi:hypothetical protein
LGLEQQCDQLFDYNGHFVHVFFFGVEGEGDFLA